MNSTKQQTLKLYYPKTHYNQNYRGFLFPLLKPFIKGEQFSDRERISMYGVSENDFEFTAVLEEADVAILTMAWNYYVLSKQESLAVDFVKECAGMHKKVIVLNAGDFGVSIPYFENMRILRFGGYASNFSDNEFSLPPFIEDPVAKYFQRDTISERPYQPKPVVGFCGQANASKRNAAKEIVKTSLRNLKSFLGFGKQEPQQLLSTSYLRASVLAKLQQSDAVETNFILRKKYRAGVTEKKDTDSTTLAFYNNLNTSDYVVCVRGAGNFSVRFYEALAMGRIPILINTDCSLPFKATVDWKKQVVWVAYSERNKVSDIVHSFHKGMNPQQFQNLQQQNRRLWEERLTLKSFFKNYLNSIVS